MSQTDLTAIIRQPGEIVSIIEIHGEITRFAERLILATFNLAGSLPARVLILDFTHMEYMNSSGIGLLVSMLVKTNRRKQHLLAAGLNDYYRQIFEVTRLDQAIQIYGSVAAAQAAAEELVLPFETMVLPEH